MSYNPKQNESDESQNIIKSYNFKEIIIEALKKSQISVYQNSPEDLDKQHSIKEQHSREVQKELALILMLQQKIKNLIQKNSSKDIWWEKLPKLLPNNRKIINSELNKLDETLTLAIGSLHSSSDNIYFAKNIRFETERAICKYNYPRSGFLLKWFLQIYHSPSIPIKVLSGLISAIFIYGGIAFGIIIVDRSRFTISNYLIPFNSLKKEYQRENISQKNQTATKHIQSLDEIAIALAGGTLGSIISILIRIEQFNDHKYLDSMTPFLIGAVKPIIGGGFGLVFLAFINSQIFLNPNVIKLTDDVGQKKSIIFAVAFIVGFSERLAKDTIGKAEDILSSRQTITETQKANYQFQNSEDGSKKEVNIQAQTTATQTKNEPQSTEQ
ncbi:hypothetical protein [Nostoc sp.]|uniref:hypothetical protein n=1 Tax=Nostoc sp. TaxID=1180 RepID=UPI002FF75226